MIYHIRDFVNTLALVMLYYSFVYSRLTYGITARGTAAKNQLREIEVKLNNIIRTMTWNKKCIHVSQLYKNLGFLKLHNVYKLELAKFMHKLFKNTLPKLCNYNFTTINKIHDYATRKPSRSNYFFLESLNLLDRIKSNLKVLNYEKKLVKILKVNHSILLTSSLKKIYREITDHTVWH